MNRRLICSAALLGVLGCGEPEYVPKGTNVEGSFQGITFKNPSALFSSREQTGGTNAATVFISDVPADEACAQIQSDKKGPGGRSAVFSDAGLRLPSLVLDIPAQSAFSNHRSELPNGFTASFDPGCTIVAVTDAGTQVYDCAQPVAADAGTVWVYETDSIKADDQARAKARFDLNFPEGQRVQGGFVATPCAGVSSGCSVGGGSMFALLSIATALFVGRRRRAL